jgi:transposase
MEHYAGLDVSIKETSVFVIDGTGRVVREVKVPTEPEAILAVLSDEDFNIKRIGLEAGPLSQWLYGELAEAGLPMICVETRHMRAALSAQVNKSDRNDARGIAHMMRVWTVPTGSCQDASQPETADAADESPAAAS